jgi:hypothetical protein
MEFTKITRGCRQWSGASIASGRRLSAKPFGKTLTNRRVTRSA